MSSREENAKLFRDAVDAWNRRDSGAVVGFLDPEVESHVSDGLLNAGNWRGLEGFGEMAAGWEDVWGELDYEVVRTDTPDDEHVVGEVHQTGKGAQSGVPVELTVFFMAEIRNDRAVRFHIYPDREAALAAVAGRQAPGPD